MDTELLVLNQSHHLVRAVEVLHQTNPSSDLYDHLAVATGSEKNGTGKQCVFENNAGVGVLFAC